MASCAGMILSTALVIVALSSCSRIGEAKQPGIPSDSSGVPEKVGRPEQAEAPLASERRAQPVMREGSAGAPAAANPQDKAVEDAVLKLFSANVSVATSARGDLNGDRVPDVVAVLEDAAGTESDPRRLVILLGNGNGSLEKVADNPGAILCRACGGTMGDPLSPIVIEPGAFILTFEGGSRELWSRAYRFAYSNKARDWYLLDTEIKTLDRIDGQSRHRTVKASPHSVSISEFDAKSMAEDPEI